MTDQHKAANANRWRGTTNDVYALLVDAYENGTLFDALNEYATEAESAAYAKGYGHGYDDGTDRGYAEAVGALEGLLDKRRNKK